MKTMERMPFNFSMRIPSKRQELLSMYLADYLGLVDQELIDVISL